LDVIHILLKEGSGTRPGTVHPTRAPSEGLGITNPENAPDTSPPSTASEGYEA